jgi:hypothetical protein
MRNHTGTYAGIPLSDNATAMGAIVYKVMIWVAIGAMFGAFRVWRYAGHTQRDVDAHLATWQEANKRYSSITDCGELTGDACLSQIAVNAPQALLATEAAFRQVKADYTYEVAHARVPDACKVAFTNFATAVDRLYLIEDKVLVTIEDNDRAALKALVFPENVANANMRRFAAVDGKECSGY